MTNKAIIPVKTGAYDVFQSGSIILVGRDPASFELDDGYILKLILGENKNKSEYYVDVNHVSHKKLIELQIFNLAVGENGFIHFWELGTLKNRILYFNFRIIVSAVHDLEPILHYTFYLGEEAKK